MGYEEHKAKLCCCEVPESYTFFFSMLMAKLPKMLWARQLKGVLASYNEPGLIFTDFDIIGLAVFFGYFIRDTCPTICLCEGKDSSGDDSICSIVGTVITCFIVIICPIYLPIIFVNL